MKTIRISKKDEENGLYWVATYVNDNYCGGAFKDAEEVEEIIKTSNLRIEDNR